MRASLSHKCSELPAPIGGEDIARKLIQFISQNPKSNKFARILLFQSLRYLAIAYRAIIKQKSASSVSSEATTFSNSTNAAELRKYILSGTRFEHLISGASESYQRIRHQIARNYYGQ